MLSSIFLVFTITTIHISGAYLRYIPFKGAMEDEQRKKLWRGFGVIGAVFAVLYFALISKTGIVPGVYKAVVSLGWIPYQCFFMYMIRGRRLSHLFVFSMSVLWIFILHSFSSIVAAATMQEQPYSLAILFHALLYPVWFFALLPLERRIFSSLLPAFELFNRPAVKIYTAVLPFVMVGGYLVLISDRELWHSWDERIARLILPAAFFLLYHYILNFSQKLFNQNQLQHTADILKQEIAYMEEGRLLVADSHKKTKRLQSELLHTYNELEALLRQGNTQTAQAYITQQEELLSSTAIYSYTDYPIINAAVSIYAHRAEAIGISVFTKINLPGKMSTDENELAVLIANLFENALLATAKERESKKITMILQHNGAQCVLEIANTFSAPVEVDEEGFPRTSHSGHGLGMLSLRNFLQKYDGYADFSQKDGWVRLCIYWEDKSC